MDHEDPGYEMTQAKVTGVGGQGMGGGSTMTPSAFITTKCGSGGDKNAYRGILFQFGGASWRRRGGKRFGVHVQGRIPGDKRLPPAFLRPPSTTTGEDIFLMILFDGPALPSGCCSTTARALSGKKQSTSQRSARARSPHATFTKAREPRRAAFTPRPRPRPRGGPRAPRGKGGR